jgi:hypothetical protein
VSRGQISYRNRLLTPHRQIADNTVRDANEGENGFLKDPAHEALDEADRRTVHGVAAQSVFVVAFLVMAANVRRIRLSGEARRRGWQTPSAPSTSEDQALDT